MKKIRVMIVDDHSVVRMGLTAILNLEKDLVVCGAAESGAEAADAALRFKPDVIVMDLMMPDMDGSEATAAIRKILPDAKILILTTFGTSRELSRAVSAGATGAVTKNIANAELVAAIHAEVDYARAVERRHRKTARALEDAHQAASERDIRKTRRGESRRGGRNRHASAGFRRVTENGPRIFP